MHITTWTESCVGSGQCALAVPEVFDQDQDEGTVRLLDADPGQALQRRVREAAISCPMQAISVSESR